MLLNQLLTVVNIKKVDPVNIYLLKVNNRNTRARCEISSKLTIKTPERRQWSLSGVFIVNFEYISHLSLVLLASWIKVFILLGIAEAHSEPSQASKMELFAKKVNSWKRVTIFARRYILDKTVFWIRLCDGLQILIQSVATLNELTHLPLLPFVSSLKSKETPNKI